MSRNHTSGSGPVVVGALLIGAVIVISGCMLSAGQLTEQEATRVATTAGLEEISVGGIVPSLFFTPCDKGDSVYREVTGISTATKQKTSIVICKGVFKGFTVRYR